MKKLNNTQLRNITGGKRWSWLTCEFIALDLHDETIGYKRHYREFRRHCE